MPVLSNNRSNQQLSSETNDTTRMNTDNRKSKNDIDDISKIATSARPKVEILRANSPTFKRLVGVRIKLEKYITSICKTISPSQLFVSEAVNYEKPSTAATVRISSPPQKRIKSRSKPGTAPVHRITYEKTSTHNGNVKQKCSLEIWLPKAGLDDEDGNTSRAPSPDVHLVENYSQSPQSMSTKSRRSSGIKFSAKTAAISEIKSLDETSSKRSEPPTIPRAYRYEEQQTDPPEERPRSDKSGNTNKSDGNLSNKTVKRSYVRSNHRPLPVSTSNTEETVQTTTSVLPMSSKNLLANIKQTHAGQEIKGTATSTNSIMINELMRKYSMLKRSHQELTQPRLQLEKPYQDSKHNAYTTKDHSLPSPPGSDSISHTSADQPLVTVRKLLNDNSPPPTAGDCTNTKITDRRSSYRKSSYADVYPQTRIVSLVNHLQHRQIAASLSTAVLPAVIGKRTEEPLRSFERSKTLDVVFAVPNPRKISSRLPAQPDSPHNLPNSSNILPRTTNRNEQSPPVRPSKRSLPSSIHTNRSTHPPQQTSQPLVQLVQYQNIQNTAQRYHLTAHPSSSSTATTDMSTSKVLVHLKYSNGGNTDRNCLIPE